MRAALRQFLDELVARYRELHRQCAARRDEFALAHATVGSEEELIEVLCRITLGMENPECDGDDSMEVPGYAHGVVAQRAKRVFGGRFNAVLRQAGTGINGGLRAVVEEYVQWHLDELVEVELRARIRAFYEIEYGTGPERDYEKMWADHENYLAAHRERLPRDVQARAEQFVHGSTVLETDTPFPFEPLMEELFLIHPGLMVRVPPG